MTEEDHDFVQQLLEHRDELYRETARLKSRISELENFESEKADYWIIRTKLTPFHPEIQSVFSVFTHMFCVTIRQMLTPFEVAIRVSESGAC